MAPAPSLLGEGRAARLQGSVGEPYFSYWTIFTLALVGGVLGVLMMIPLRRSLIVKEHAQPPLPRGHGVRVGADRRREGRRPGAHRLPGRGLRVRLRAPAEGPARHRRDAGAGARADQPATSRRRRVNGDITPEYLGVGYIIGPRIAGVLVAGGVLAWLGLIPLLASLVPPDADRRAAGEAGLPRERRHRRAARAAGIPATHTFADTATRHLLRLRAPDRRGRGGGGRLHHAAQDAAHHRRRRSRRASRRCARRDGGAASAKRTERDLPITVVLVGALVLVLVMAVLPFVPGDRHRQQAAARRC